MLEGVGDDVEKDALNLLRVDGQFQLAVLGRVESQPDVSFAGQGVE